MQFSWFTFLGLAALVLAAFAMTAFLSSRYTSWRRHFVMRDFAASRGMKLVRSKALPELLPARITGITPRPGARWHFSDGTLSLVRLQAGSDTFNVVLVKIASDWPATALRPSAQAYSLFDKLELFSYPSSYSTLRFTLHGLDPPAARTLSDSPCRGLLPADLGLLLEGTVMLIDFSSRPFDPIELGRMIALGRQLAGVVPVISQTA